MVISDAEIKAYQTSLDRQIENLKPGLACRAPTKFVMFFQKFDINKRQSVKNKSFRKERGGSLNTKTDNVNIIYIEN